jgi:hypothetical protein
MPNYAKTLIYKIVCKDVNVKKIYGGHTTHIIKRRANHKSMCNNINSKKYNIYLYQFIRENGGFNNWHMIWCYDFPCKNRREATLEERKFIEFNKCELNSNKAFTTREEKKEYKKNKSKNYYVNNKEKSLNYQKEYRKDNKNKAKEYYQNNKEKAKKYYEKNKEKIKNYQKINKKKIAAYKKHYYEKNKEKTICNCVEI